jgi:hypothetical protein
MTGDAHACDAVGTGPVARGERQHGGLQRRSHGAGGAYQSGSAKADGCHCEQGYDQTRVGLTSPTECWR